MAKLYFKYGAMGSSKTAQALITKYNYEENGMRVWLIKPAADSRDGEIILRSRVGLEAPAEVIGATAEIGDDCLLYQGVTLGGTGAAREKRHPTLGNNVMVGCGAKILGPFKVGDNARIAANSVVLEEVPANSTVVGVPGRVVRLNGEKLDHIHTPDPVRAELDYLHERLEKLEKEMEEK